MFNRINGNFEHLSCARDIICHTSRRPLVRRHTVNDVLRRPMNDEEYAAAEESNEPTRSCLLCFIVARRQQCRWHWQRWRTIHDHTAADENIANDNICQSWHRQLYSLTWHRGSWLLSLPVESTSIPSGNIWIAAAILTAVPPSDTCQINTQQAIGKQRHHAVRSLPSASIDRAVKWRLKTQKLSANSDACLHTWSKLRTGSFSQQRAVKKKHYC